MRPILRPVALGLLLLAAAPAWAFTVAITPGTRAIYLQVGNGSFTGQYSSGGTPGNNATVNLVSVTVPAAQLGNGTDQQMTSNSTVGNSFYDGYAFCTANAQVYIGGFFRRPSGSSNASLTVTTPATLTTVGDSIPFSQIRWTASGNGDTGAQPIPSGTFTGGTQTLASFPSNSWRESCHTFFYANDQVVGAGVYTGRAVYTLSAP